MSLAAVSRRTSPQRQLPDPGKGTANPERTTTPRRDMGWLDRLITETTQICREALGSWDRTGQLCLLLLTIAAALALLLCVLHD